MHKIQDDSLGIIHIGREQTLVLCLIIVFNIK